MEGGTYEENITTLSSHRFGLGLMSSVIVFLTLFLVLDILSALTKSMIASFEVP